MKLGPDEPLTRPWRIDTSRGHPYPARRHEDPVAIPLCRVCAGHANVRVRAVCVIRAHGSRCAGGKARV